MVQRIDCCEHLNPILHYHKKECSHRDRALEHTLLSVQKVCCVYVGVKKIR